MRYWEKTAIQRRTERDGRSKTNERRERNEESDLTVVRRASERAIDSTPARDFRVKNDTGILSGLSPPEILRLPRRRGDRRDRQLSVRNRSRGIARKTAQKSERCYRPSRRRRRRRRRKFALPLFLPSRSLSFIL